MSDAMQITRANVESLLDRGEVEAAIHGGRWWRIRRNGRTQTWKTDANRIRIPVKAGLRSCGAITERHFNSEGVIDSSLFRIKV